MKKILLSVVTMATLISSVDAREIKLDEYKAFAAQAMRIDYDKAPADIQAKIKDEYIQKIKLSEILVKRYQNDPDFMIIKENIALELWTKRVMASVKPTEETLKTLYTQSGDLNVAPQYKARHIMVKQESLATELLTQIKSKIGSERDALFTAMVEKYSLDMTSKKDQGNIGWVDSGKLSPQASELIKSQEKGSVFIMRAAEELWEVVILDNINEGHIATFDEAKEFLINQLQRKTLQDEAAKLLKPAPVNKSKVPSPKK